jgi:hypothetical protein
LLNNVKNFLKELTMGGQALKNTITRRYAKQEYVQLRDEVLDILKRDFPERKVAAIQAYRAKESFGDLDILFETDQTNFDLLSYIKQMFKPNEFYKNGNVISFDYQQFQIDLIGSPREDFDISSHYFAWYDLGNIIGRLYHKMGFKYGHNGLSLLFKDDNYQYEELCFSKDIEAILGFADLDAKRFLQGFDTLEDIFSFAVSSQFFNRDIYLLDNRNHASRIRDKKRPTYNALLKWLESQEHLPAYPWTSVREQGGRRHQAEFLERAFAYFPHLKPQYEQIQAQFKQWQMARQKFNGRLVGASTGLSEQALGHFMQWLKAQAQLEFVDFQKWLAEQPADVIADWIKQQYQVYQQPAPQ